MKNGIKTLAMWLIIGVITIVLLSSIMENSSSKMTYSELITSIENSDVESVKISSGGTTASVKLKSAKLEKEVSLPSVDSFMEYIEEYISGQKVIKAFCKEDKVLEIGPGLGSLTHFLQNHNLDVCDIDERMCRVIEAIYSNKNNIKVFNNDILKFDVSKYNKIISNLPYYITSDIISYLLLNAKNCDEMVFMVQKEAALRFLDSTNKTEPLSILINLVGDIKKVYTVKPSSFVPAPHVDSVVFKINIFKSNF